MTIEKRRDLLERAARAAGYEVEFDTEGLMCWFKGKATTWRPHLDDGDALRVAVKLRMSVTVFDDAVGIGIKDWGYREYPIDGGDYEAATRLAILRAAAAMAPA